MRHTKKIVTCTLALGLPLIVAHAQSSRPAFEVVSVKPNTIGGQTMVGNQRGGRFVALNATIYSLFTMAFRPMQYSQIVGGPNWMRTERFDIEGKAERPLTGQEADAAVRSILEDRFQLRTHRETRELPIYELGVDKGGSKLKSPDIAGPSPAGTVSSGPGRVAGSGISMAALTAVLSAMTGRTVVDKTNLSGTFAVMLDFAPDSQSISQDAGPGGGDSRPTLFTALQEQLGLKLESARGPVEVLVIDSVQRPSEN